MTHQGDVVVIDDDDDNVDVAVAVQASIRSEERRQLRTALAASSSQWHCPACTTPNVNGAPRCVTCGYLTRGFAPAPDICFGVELEMCLVSAPGASLASVAQVLDEQVRT